MDEPDEVAELRERLRFVSGQMHMLVGFLLAVIDTHPDPTELARHFETAAQITLALSEGALIPEKYLDGELNILARLKDALENARARQAASHKERDPG